MNFTTRIRFIFLALLIGIFLFIPIAEAAKPVAEVSGFKGEVFLLTGKKIVRVTSLGQILNEGDMVQTKEGEVEITFNDGALLKIRPFSNTFIQEREEETGFLIFKTKKLVRRFTLFVGKFWFESGIDIKENYIQTATAVSGIRGSKAWVMDDGVKSQVNLIEGELFGLKNFERVEFEPRDPGREPALKNVVYSAFNKAVDKHQKATETGKTLDQAEAKVVTIQVLKVSNVELQKNPDDAVKKEAEVNKEANDASLAAAGAEVSVEKAKKVAETVEVVKEAAEKAKEAAREAEEAANELNLEKLREADEKVEKNFEILGITFKASESGEADGKNGGLRFPPTPVPKDGGVGSQAGGNGGGTGSQAGGNSGGAVGQAGGKGAGTGGQGPPEAFEPPGRGPRFDVPPNSVPPIDDRPPASRV